MNGAEALLRTLLDAGVEVCFTNPGTSEMHFVAALDRVPGMRCVLGLFEGVVTGAADGYARIARKPAATLLHLGPGLGNGLANLHNARKAEVPMLNIVGDHATWHLQYDTPLTSDVAAVAQPMSHWVHSSASSEEVAADAARGLAVALSAPGHVATLILPANVSWSETVSGPARLPAVRGPQRVDDAQIDAAAMALRAGEPAMILLGGHIDDAQLEAAGRIAAHTGARLAVETFPARMPVGEGHAAFEKIPYLAEFAIEHLKTVRELVLVGARAPASFFAYPGLPSELADPDCRLRVLAGLEDDRLDALQRLAEMLGATGTEPHRNRYTPSALATGGPNTTATVADTIAALLPTGAIVADESITCGFEIFGRCGRARAHEWIIETGGSIGWGLPAATGAAVAAPERKVVCLEGDGSAMYTIQALWTMARENLDITVVIFANRDYAILQLEFRRVGATAMGERARNMMHIGKPDIDFVSLARSLGVNAERAEDAASFAAAFAGAMRTRGPYLIEVTMPSSQPTG